MSGSCLSTVAILFLLWLSADARVRKENHGERAGRIHNEVERRIERVRTPLERGRSDHVFKRFPADTDDEGERRCAQKTKRPATLESDPPDERANEYTARKVHREVEPSEVPVPCPLESIIIEDRDYCGEHERKKEGSRT